MFQTLKSNLREMFFLPQMNDGKDITSRRKEKLVEAFGSITGILGAFWLASQMKGYSYAYVLFLLSSASLTIYFARNKQGWIMLQQVAFTAVNLLGVYTWIIKS